MAYMDLRPQMELVWWGGSAGRRLVAEIADFEKAVVKGGGSQCVGKWLRRLGCRISLSRVTAEGFRKVRGEFAGWWVGIPRCGEKSGEASVLHGVDGTGGHGGS